MFASQIFRDPSLLEFAELGAQFIGKARIVDAKNKNHGLIWGAEGVIHGVNTSCILECLDGLMALAKATGKTQYWTWVEEAVLWVARKGRSRRIEQSGREAGVGGLGPGTASAFNLSGRS